jgi:hypothetical protein
MKDREARMKAVPQDLHRMQAAIGEAWSAARKGFASAYRDLPIDREQAAVAVPT